MSRGRANCLVDVVGSKGLLLLPIGSMHGIFTYSYHKHQLNVGKYTIHGSCGLGSKVIGSVGHIANVIVFNFGHPRKRPRKHGILWGEHKKRSTRITLKGAKGLPAARKKHPPRAKGKIRARLPTDPLRFPHCS